MISNRRRIKTKVKQYLFLLFPLPHERAEHLECISINALIKDALLFSWNWQHMARPKYHVHWNDLQNLSRVYRYNFVELTPFSLAVN